MNKEEIIKQIELIKEEIQEKEKILNDLINKLASIESTIDDCY